MSKLGPREAQLRAMREARYAKESLTIPRAETAKTTIPVVETTKSVGAISAKTTKMVVDRSPGKIETTKLVGALPDDFRELMVIADLTQKQFAEMTGTPLRTVENWSRGASPAPPIAKAWLKLYCETG